MFRLRTICYLIVILLLVTSTSQSYTKVGRTKKKKNNFSSKMEYTPIKYNLLLKGSIGYMVESGDDFSSFYKPDNKMFYGFGFAFEYHTEGKHAFGINYDRLFNNYNIGSFSDKFLVQVYTVSYIYKFRTKKASIPIATFHFGTAIPDIRNATSAKTIKVGLGFIGHTGSKSNFKSVFYYQKFFSSDELSIYLIDGKLNLFGFDIYWGIPL